MSNYQIASKLIGKRVKFTRYGNIPETGISFNWAEQETERGENGHPALSVYCEGQKPRSEFAEIDTVITGTAIVIGTGSDDEALIDTSSIDLDCDCRVDNIESIKSVYRDRIASLTC